MVETLLLDAGEPSLEALRTAHPAAPYPRLERLAARPA
jgi:hypothetical protein